jgi:hypothetical protein
VARLLDHLRQRSARPPSPGSATAPASRSHYARAGDLDDDAIPVEERTVTAERLRLGLDR